MPTLCRGEGPESLTRMGPGFLLPPNSQRGLSRSCVPLGVYPVPTETLAPFCQIPTLNCSSPLGLSGLEWERRKRPTSCTITLGHRPTISIILQYNK